MRNLVVLIIVASNLLAIPNGFAAGDGNGGAVKQIKRFVRGKLRKHHPSLSTCPQDLAIPWRLQQGELLSSATDPKSDSLPSHAPTHLVEIHLLPIDMSCSQSKELIEKLDPFVFLDADDLPRLTKEHMGGITRWLDEIIEVDPFFPLKEGRVLMASAEKLKLLPLQILYSTYQMPMTDTPTAKKLIQLYASSNEDDEGFVERLKIINQQNIGGTLVIEDLPKIIQKVMSDSISQVLNHIVDHENDIFMVDSNGNSALHYAYFYGKKRALSTLLEGTPDLEGMQYRKKIEHMLSYRNLDGLRAESLQDLGLAKEEFHLGPNLLLELIEAEQWHSVEKLVRAGAHVPTNWARDVLLPFEKEEYKKILIREVLQSMNEKQLNEMSLDQLVELVGISFNLTKPAVREDFVVPQLDSDLLDNF